MFGDNKVSPESTTSKPTRVQPVRRAEAMSSTLRCLRVLDFLAEDPFELSVSDVAARLSIAMASAHRLLATLCQGGVVDQDPVTRRYRLAQKMLWVGAGVLRHSSLYRASFLVMQELAKQVDGTVHLGVWDNGAVLFMYSVGYPSKMQILSDVGDRRPLNVTATGKVMLAYRPVDEAQKIMARAKSLTEKTITTFPRMKTELERIRKLGYAMNDEEMVVGIRAIAAPIRNQRGEVIAGVSIAGSTDQLTGKKLDRWATLLRVAADRVSRQLGFRLGSFEQAAPDGAWLKDKHRPGRLGARL